MTENSEKTQSNKRKSRDNSEKTGFRLNAAQLFLTYAQCNVLPNNALVQLKTKFNNIVDYVIAQEKHKSGDLHLHVYLKLGKKTNIRNATFLDLIDGPITFHGKYEGVRSPKCCIKYCVKDGNYITTLDSDFIKKILRDLLRTGEIYEKARETAKAGDLNGALSVLEHPKTARDLTINGETIRRNLESLVPSNEDKPRHISTFDYEFEYAPELATILWGPTGTGKTSLARALLPKALFVSHVDQLKMYNARVHHGIIFDDMSFVHWPEGNQIHLVDWEQGRYIHTRYVPAFIPARTPKIFTYNLPPENILRVGNPAIARRVISFEITKSVRRITLDHSQESNDENERINHLIDSDGPLSRSLDSDSDFIYDNFLSLDQVNSYTTAINTATRVAETEDERRVRRCIRWREPGENTQETRRELDEIRWSSEEEEEISP